MPEILQGSNAEARLLADERFLRKIAYFYYEDGHSQETIAEMEHCSRQTVGKALQKARERSIVRISVVPDLRTGYLRNLSRDVRSQLGLEDLILVPGRNIHAQPSDELLNDIVMNIAVAAGEYLDQLLTDSDILAVSGGKTIMRNIVRFLKPTKLLPQLQVVATIGLIDPNTSYGDANLIAFDLATVYGANHTWFPCPAILNSQDQINTLRELPAIKEGYDLMNRANIIVMGLFTPDTNTELVTREVISSEQLQAIQAHNPVVDLNHWIFDAEGNCINELIKPSPYYLSGLDIPKLKENMARRDMKVILVAGGGARFISAIRATIKAGIVNILVTDHVTAELLLLNA